MLEHAVLRLSPLLTEIAISVRSIPVSASTSRLGLPLIVDETPDLGPAMAVYSCLKYAGDHGFEGILITPVDMPDLETDHLRTLLVRWQNEALRRLNETERGVVTATFDSVRAQPLISIYPIHYLGAIGQVVQSPRRSLNDWLSQQPSTWVPLPPSAQRNRNSPSD